MFGAIIATRFSDPRNFMKTLNARPFLDPVYELVFFTITDGVIRIIKKPPMVNCDRAKVESQDFSSRQDGE
jgi:hypothetical protein